MARPNSDFALDDRQARERAYHVEFAHRNRDKAEQAVLLDVIEPGARRPWNGYWSAYDLLMAHGVTGKRVLIPGCGFGEDAIRIAKLGGRVYASDLSEELLEIARRRAVLMGVADIQFDVMPAEALTYPDDFFDVILFNGILHHVAIPAALAQAQRVLRPGGYIVVNELYTHSALQRIRTSRIISTLLYPHMVRSIYGTQDTYITEDEHKIDEHELAMIEAVLQPDMQRSFFMLFAGRIVPPYHTAFQKFDRVVLNWADNFGRLLAGRIVLSGAVRK